jgi:hypothetical protein
MALISIPTSIGGVSIPGLAVNGPLGLLYKNPFGRNDLQYPRDLQSATRGHVVHFAINEINPLTYEQTKDFLIKSGKDIAAAAPGVASNLISNPGEVLINGFKSLSSGELTQQANLLFKNRTKKSNKSISLYMPDTLNFTYSASYGQTDLLTAASSIPVVGGAVSAVTQAINNPLARLALKGAGYALNPNQQVLFDGIDFRNYQLAFTFTPYSKQEAQTVAAIIKMFKTYSTPRLVEGAGGGMFFVPPSTFTPTFKFNGQRNKNINQVTESVITNIIVDYAPQGFAAHTDGAPVQTTLTIDFRELELITSQKVEQGY